MRRTVWGLFVVAALAAAVVVAGLIRAAASPYRGFTQPVFVEIAPRTPTRQIARQLRDAGVLRSEWPFLALHYVRPGRKLKAGEYYFDSAVSPRQVLDKLRRGEIYYHTITVPEGYNIFEVAAALAASGLVGRDEALQAVRNAASIADLSSSATSLEGYLFPDTYRFTRHTPAGEMAAAMVARFRKVYAELEKRYTPSRPVYDIVTMASLVEKETGVPGERPLVASVFYNRLAANMPLQCDPTVIYAAMLDGRYRGAIHQSDLAFDSGYNTYLHAGLPPGPIANPGRKSLEAAMTPAPGNYLYFVANGQSGHRFSATLKEHAGNVAAYRRSSR